MTSVENLAYLPPVIVAYGFNRKESDLRAAGAERVWPDTTEDRPELAAMIDKLDLALRPGDTLLVISPADLGRHKRTLPRRLAEMGVAVQVRGHEPIMCSSAERLKAWLAQGDKGRERVVIDKGGRPPKFNPTPEQNAALAALWRSPAKRAYVMRRAEKIMGGPVKDYWLRDRYGKRNED